MKSTDRSRILDAITTKTKVIALITLIVEALFLTAVYFLPSEQRILAFIICASLILVALIGIFYIETLETKSAKTQTFSVKSLPNELKDRTLILSNYLQTAEGKIADRYRTATALKYVGKYKEALRHYKEILNQDEHHLLALYNIGSCELYIGNLSESESVYEDLLRRMVHMNWKDSEEKVRMYHGALMQLYCVAEKQSDFDKGERHLLRSLEVRPDDALSYLNFVICCLKAGKNADAHKWYDILMNHPDRVSVLSDLNMEDQELLDTIKNLKEEVLDEGAS